MNYWLKLFNYQLLFFSFSFLGIHANLIAQVKVELTILDGAATTPSCGGFLDNGETAIGIIIENQTEITYSPENCPNIPEFPNLQYDTTLNCLSDLRGGEIQICFRTYFREFTGFFGNNKCEVPNADYPCGTIICPNILLPSPGKDSVYTLTIDENLGFPSFGFVTFRISVSEDANANPIAANDRICHAINMGTLSQGITLGDNQIGSFNNYCATSISEPSPHQEGIQWQNNVATWFTFTTSNDPNAVVLVEAISDPENVNDPVNLQLALYKSDDNSCGGNLEFIAENFEGNDFDEHLISSCLEPNTQYFLMVDGETTNAGLLNGTFGLQIKEVNIQTPINDEICNAIPLAVSTAGQITEMYSNLCATNTTDPITDFTITNSVWFKFVPSQSRRVFINVDSDVPYPLGIDAIDPEIAVFYAPTNQCNAALIEVANQNSAGNVNSEFLSLECLNPKNTYYILVDGSDLDPTGVFSVTVAERGYPDPISIDTTICRGGLLNLGNKSYANAGIYIDTIVMDDECLQIIETNLVAAEPLDLDLRLGELARGEGQGGGVMIANAQFGTGDYSFEWSNGQANQVANSLIGGEQYCLTVRDNNAACMVDTCFIMEFPIPTRVNVFNDTVDCSYSETGQARFEITDGKPPYRYWLSGINNPSFSTNPITVNKNDTLIILENIPIGNYNIFLIDSNQLPSNFQVAITTPAPISIDLMNKVNATCFEACNGRIELEINGGTGALNFAWDNGLDNIQNPSNICAGNYSLMVTDENNCVDSAKYLIAEPDAPIVGFYNITPVTCFGENNGQASINVNEPITNILWDNGETTERVNNLNAGTHQVTITNENGCESTNSVIISQPTAPLTAAIDIMETIACGGDSNGVLADASTGGNANYQYRWSNGSNVDFIDNLAAGTYSLIVQDEKGCEDETTVTLAEPVPIDASISVQDVNCPAGESSGIVFINNPTGGTAPYRFAVNNQNFISNTEITNLRAGTYAVLMQDDKGCEKTFENIIINNPPKVTVNLGEDRTIQLGNTIELKATIKRQVTFEWSSTDSLSCLDCAIISSRPFNDAIYSVRVTDIETGCIAEDAIAISVLKTRNLYVPNAFSPNGDGINDQLTLFGGNDIDRILRFEIYARNGSMVYKQDNFFPNGNLGWDGTFDRQAFSPDVFIYFAEVRFIDGAEEVFTGDFTLLR